MRPHTPRSAVLAALLILTVLPACDNVEWGGGSMQVVAPPPAGGVEPDLPEPGTTPGSLGLPAGSVIFHVIRGEGGTAQVIPVAEISGDSLRTLRRPAEVSPEAFEERFRATLLEPNAQLELFRRGARVGTFTVQENGPVTACGLPTARGIASTVAAAAAEPEFLAFRRGLAPETRGEFSPPQVDGTIRRYASLIAERLVLQNGLPRPRSWPGAQRDLQALDAERGGHPEMAATYLVGDNLAVGPAERDGYAVFYIASYETRTGYTPFYSDVRRYDQVGGKAAPRMVDHLDWNSSGEPEILVQVFGPDQHWYEAVSRDGGRWNRVWQGSPCRVSR